MKQPFWIVNSALLILTMITAGFIYFFRPAVPLRQSITPVASRLPTKTETATVNISKIYEDDLFGTYQKEVIAPDIADRIEELPQAPMPTYSRAPEEPKPQFIEPLPVSLKGIVVVRNDDTKNRAILMDNRTNKEQSYRIGDMIEDAQLVRIFSNKVVLMRANGQQEVLYLREKDAKLDPTYANTNNWQEVIARLSDDTFTINTAEFISRIPSLAQFIDTLELATAYKQGESIGCRVANTGPGSLGAALGFTKEDLIQKVNDISIASPQQRLAAYQNILELKTNDVIRVTLIRNNNEINYQYILQEVQPPKKQEIGMQPIPTDHITPEQRTILEKEHTFAPTLKEIREKERKKMLENGKRPAHNILTNLNE